MDEASPRTEVQSGRRRPWFGLLLAAALITAGVGAWMLGEPPERMTARVLGPPGPDGQPMGVPHSPPTERVQVK